MFRKMPFILLTVILLVSLGNPWMSLSFKSILYAISLSLKSIIVFVLPFLVFGLLFKTAGQLARKASKMICFLLLFICISNFISTLLSYSVGILIYHLPFSMTIPSVSSALVPAWTFSLPKWVGNDQAMFSGLFLGILCGWWKPHIAGVISLQLEKIIGNVLKGFLLVIPFFIVGFVVKMNHDEIMRSVIRDYGVIFCIIAVSVFTYISFIYFISSRCRFSLFIQSLKNMLPAAIAGFGSMSSAAAMPLTILGTEKNAQNPNLARAVIPITVNIHLIGDCFAIPIFAFAVMKSFGVVEPLFWSYIVFAFYFVLAKFSVAAVPGGGILVMLPVLKGFLGFNGEMLSFITALYILFDPVITCANVLGNGGFAMGMGRLMASKSS